MKKVVQLPAIASEGRFANRLLHYIVGKCYAESIGATVEIPKGWIGETIFEINEDYIEEHDPEKALPAFFNMPHRLVDPCLTRETVKRLLKWKPDWVRVTAKRESVAHLRRGDFLTDKGFPVVSPDCIFTECKRLVGVPFFVSENSPQNNGLFSKMFSFLEDFQILMQSKNVFVYPRSTFSQMAALLGDGNIYMPYDYKAGRTSCKFRLVDPFEPVIFPTKNNNLP